MLDYAISKNRQRRPAKRMYASLIASCCLHFLMLMMLIQFPQLLQGGMYHRFRALSSIQDILSQDESENWRTVTVIRDRSPMMAPSAATLRKYAYDWYKKNSGAPPVRIRWGEEQKAALNEASRPVPRPKPQQPLPPANEIAVAPSASTQATNPASSSGRDTAENDPGGRKNIYLPPPGEEPKQKVGLAADSAPGSIPNSKPSTGSSGTQNNPNKPEAVARIFDNEQQALRSPEGGFFDTKGFPLGEYANLIIERIKGKWFIPSHLRDAQGHTTVVFFINKEGRFTDARIVASSGSDSLDLAALNAVMASNPFPPLPKGFPGDHVGAKFIFSYNEPQ